MSRTTGPTGPPRGAAAAAGGGLSIWFPWATRVNALGLGQHIAGEGDITYTRCQKCLLFC